LNIVKLTHQNLAKSMALNKHKLEIWTSVIFLNA